MDFTAGSAVGKVAIDREMEEESKRKVGVEVKEGRKEVEDPPLVEDTMEGAKIVQDGEEEKAVQGGDREDEAIPVIPDQTPEELRDTFIDRLKSVSFDRYLRSSDTQAECLQIRRSSFDFKVQSNINKLCVHSFRLFVHTSKNPYLLSNLRFRLNLRPLLPPNHSHANRPRLFRSFSHSSNPSLADIHPSILFARLPIHSSLISRPRTHPRLHILSANFSPPSTPFSLKYFCIPTT